MQKVTSMKYPALLSLDGANRKHHFPGELYISQQENRKFTYMFVGDFKHAKATGRQVDVVQVRRGFEFRDEDDAMNAAIDAGITIVAHVPEPLTA